MEWIVARTDDYVLEANMFGHYTLTRFSDDGSLYFQGEADIAAVEEVLEALERDESLLDRWASEYDACIENWD